MSKKEILIYYSTFIVLVFSILVNGTIAQIKNT